MRALVTGGLGFLGSAVTRRLVAEGASVRVLDSGLRGSAKRLAEVQARVEVVDGDVRDPETVRAAVKGTDAVCHFAFVNGTRFFYEAPGLVLEVGIKGMLNVLDACIAEGVGELYLASSSEVYQTPPRVPTDEVVPLVVPDPFNPRYSYGGGKIVSELLALHYRAEALRRLVIVRPHNVYGPDMGWDHVIPELVLRVRELARSEAGALKLPLQGTGRETRAFVYVDDFSEAFLLLMKQGRHREIYNVGTMEERSIAEVAREIGRCFGREVDVVAGDLRAGSPTRRCPDTGKLQSLGFEPRVAFEDGVKRTARWYDEHADLRPAP